jgi:hypothetical protein
MNASNSLRSELFPENGASGHALAGTFAWAEI